VSNFVPFVIKFCKPGQILAEIAPNAAQSNGDHAWQPSFAAEIAKWTPSFPARPLGGLVSALPPLFLIHGNNFISHFPFI
jgi:hypothetical protein